MISFLPKFLYLIIVTYLLFSIYDTAVKEYDSLNIVESTSYDLVNILKNDSSVLYKISIDRTSNYGVFYVNHTKFVDLSTNKIDQYDLRDKLQLLNLLEEETLRQVRAMREDVNNDTTSKNDRSSNTFVVQRSKITPYGMYLPLQGADVFVDKIKNSTKYYDQVKVVYYDKSPDVFSFGLFRTIVQYYVMFLIFRFILSLSGGVTTSFDKMTGDIDTESITKKVTIKFSDVVGLLEAKRQIQKYVDIMKNRGKYSKIGAKIPKGVLLCGPPGCGKTLLAKAVAGEAGVNFISVCGSDFDEVFVGVGASRVKKLFSIARENAPCIVFIDEIDSIGEKRKTNFQKGTDTLNKILSEMDGFKPMDNIMVMASTNRETTLDSALLRSGRFDSKIYVDAPNRRERTELFSLYLKKIKLDPELEVETLADTLAKTAPGATGADVANICNQAAINAASDASDYVRSMDLSKAVDDVLIGIEKKSKKVEKDELVTTAYHEAGHALMGYLLQDEMPPMKLSIIPRGHGIAGYTLPQENELSNRTKEQLLSQIYGLLAGRGAEIVKFNVLSTGAGNDFEKATNIVTAMVTKHGMYPEFSPMVYELNRESAYCVSDQKRADIEKIVQNELQKAFSNVVIILKKYSKQLDILAQKLLEDEIVDYVQIKELLPNIENTVKIVLR